MKKYFIHFFVSGIVFGIILSNLIAIDLAIISIIILLIILFLSILIVFKLSSQSKKLLLLTLIFLFSLTIILARINQTQTVSKISNFREEKIEIIGQVSGEVDIRAFNTRLTIEAEEIRTDNSILKTREKIIAVTNHFPKYATGDRVKIYGQIQLPENFENENGIEFDYVNYLAKDDIYSTTYYPKIELLKRPEFNFERSIFAVKENFLKKAQSIIPSPESELLGGILVGTKRSLGQQLEEDFRTVGLIHIVVLSGYNVTIIAEFIFRVLSFLPKYFSATVGAISIVIFSIMVGSGATVVRSAVMALLALISRVSNKNYNVNRALFFAGTIMVLHNPAILLHDPSFQLSFLATIGLINLSDLVKKFINFLPEKLQIKEITTATLSTQISVIPLLTKMTGELSVVAPVVNVLTLQVIPITMLLGFIAGMMAFLNQTLGIIFGLIPFLFLNYILKIVDFFAGFPIATVKILF